MVVSKEELVASIKDMSVIELADLVKMLEDELGVSAAAMAAPVASAPVEASTEVVEEEEQTEFTVTLKEFSGNKIAVIKAVRELTSLGLKESKEAVENTPRIIKDSVSKEEAEAAKQKLEAVGGVIEIS